MYLKIFSSFAFILMSLKSFAISVPPLYLLGLKEHLQKECSNYLSKTEMKRFDEYMELGERLEFEPVSFPENNNKCSITLAALEALSKRNVKQFKILYSKNETDQALSTINYYLAAQINDEKKAFAMEKLNQAKFPCAKTLLTELGDKKIISYKIKKQSTLRGQEGRCDYAKLLIAKESELKATSVGYLEAIKVVNSINSGGLFFKETYVESIKGKAGLSVDTAKLQDFCFRGFIPACGIAVKFTSNIENKVEIALLRKASQFNDAAAIAALANALMRSENKDIYSLEARRLAVKAHEQGVNNAGYTLGIMYINGDGGERDPKRGVALIEDAARGGSATAVNWIKTKKTTMESCIAESWPGELIQ